ncbi:MAG: response regulator [Cyanobacteria bacterium P01_A01_bin.135]
MNTPAAQANRPTVLVVEDIPANQDLMMVVLRKFGYGATVVGDGKEALAQVQRQAYDIVLMDCKLPGLDGYETTRRLRQMAVPNAYLPVIGLTARAMFGDRDKCLAAGMDDYISKPIQLDHLQATLKKWLIQATAISALPCAASM